MKKKKETLEKIREFKTSVCVYCVSPKKVTFIIEKFNCDNRL